MSAHATDRPSGAGGRGLAMYSACVFAFLYFPIAVLVIYSFNRDGVGGFPPRHLTLDWYRTNRGWVERVKDGAYREYYQLHYGERERTFSGTT